MRLTRRWSLAARLTVWYAITAFLLVAGAALLQYRTLVTSLAAEDDQQLAERLGASRGASPATRAAEPTAREASIGLRLLNEACRPADPVVADLPPPVCRDRARLDTVRFRSWRSADGRNWRVASVHSRDPRGGWIEVLLDRSRDAGVLRDYREQLAVVLSAALLASGLLGYGIARRGLRPIAILRDRMMRVTARSLDQRLGTHQAPLEIEALVGSFDAMLDRLEAGFKSLSELSAELAHELRTPLHVLRQQFEVALGRARSAEEYREILVSSLEELDRLGRMADDMLFLARTEDPRSSIDRQPLAIAAELADVAEYLDAVAAEAGIVMEVDAPIDLGVLADRMLLRRALVNVLTNAIRYAPRGSRVRLSARANGASVLAAVEDMGAGIAPEALPHVFDRYFRLPGTTRDRSAGSGLGLAIVRGIMQLHAGTATIASTPGRGTCVTLTFSRVATDGA